jgi:hypothetical protein
VHKIYLYSEAVVLALRIVRQIRDGMESIAEKMKNCSHPKLVTNIPDVEATIDLVMPDKEIRKA